jgi:hypothetical protein
MSVTTLLLIVLLFALVGAVPRWPHSADWGYLPLGLVAVSLVIVVAIMLVHGVA